MIYQKALDLVSKIYLLIKNNPKFSHDYSLNDQLKRASVSILTNIAEGYERSKKHYQSYLSISSGSANETVSLLQVVNCIYGIVTSELQIQFKILGKQINAFSKSLNNRLPKSGN